MKLKHDEDVYTVINFKVSALDDKNALKMVYNKLNLFLDITIFLVIIKKGNYIKYRND